MRGRISIHGRKVNIFFYLLTKIIFPYIVDKKWSAKIRITL